jgi:hypothetical protein
LSLTLTGCTGSGGGSVDDLALDPPAMDVVGAKLWTSSTTVMSVRIGPVLA